MIIRKNPLDTIKNNIRVPVRTRVQVKPYIIILMIYLLTIMVISIAKAQDETTQVTTASVLWIEDQTFPTVTAYTTVTHNNVPLEGINQEDFILSEDGVEIPAESITVEPTTFNNMHLVLALDISTPHKDWARVKEATQALFDTLGPAHKLSIFSFGNKVQAELPEFTNNTGQWQDKVDEMSPGGDYTALYEAIVSTAEFIQERETTLEATRTAVIIVTDSRDNVGRLSIDEVVQQAETTQVPFYVVGYGNKVQSAHPLKEQITVTGGQYFTLANADQVQATLQKIINQVEKGYKITFSSALMADEAEHDLTISVNHEGREVTAADKFTAVSTEIDVSLPDIPEDPIVRGPLELVPEISGPAPISSITYLLDTQVLTEVTKFPYEYIWDSTSVEPGTYLLKARVVDTVGNTGNDETIVTLAEPIVVQIPNEVNEIEYGNTLTFEPQIETDVGLSVAELWIDDILVDSCDIPPCDLTVNSSGYSIGTHTITLLVEDALGQKDNATLELKILPPPAPPVWLERLSNQIGFQNYPLFKWWLNLSLDTVSILTALLLILLVILVVMAVIRRIKRIQHQKSRKQYSLEIVNLGNIQSSYALWAEDSLRFLRFQFAMNGIGLPSSPKNNVTEISQPPIKQSIERSTSSLAHSSAVATSSPAMPRTEELGQKNDQPSNKKQSLKQATAKGGQALGFLVTIAGILNTVARLLPRSMGRPIRQISGRLTSGQSKVKHITRQPAQMARQANRLQSQVSRVTPSTGKQNPVGASRSTPQQNIEQRTFQEVTAASQPSLSSPKTTSANVPITQTTQPQKNKVVKKQQHQVYHTFTEPAETPVVAPGSKLIVDLMITPSDPYRAGDYQFRINSIPVKQIEQTANRTEAVAHISGISWFRRYLPRIVAVFIGLILILLIVLLVFVLVQMDIISLLESLG